MADTDEKTEEYLEIADKIRSGEYFREGRSMYDLFVHDPMAERYLYILITTIATFILVIALLAAKALAPLERSVPFIFNSNDIVEEYPRITSLLAYKGEEPNDAVIRFLVTNYVTFREEYDIKTFDRDVGGVKSQSSSELFKEFQNAIAPSNPNSPITLFERHSKRLVKVTNVQVISSNSSGMTAEVTFDTKVLGRSDIKNASWVATVTFNYSGLELDENTDKVKPFSFLVTKYQTRRL